MDRSIDRFVDRSIDRKIDLDALARIELLRAREWDPARDTLARIDLMRARARVQSAGAGPRTSARLVRCVCARVQCPALHVKPFAETIH